LLLKIYLINVNAFIFATICSVVFSFFF